MEAKRIVAAVRSGDALEAALSSDVKTIFFLSPRITELKFAAQRAHERDKKLFIHLDLTEGLGKDRAGIEFARSSGVDGIISTRSNIIKLARECGLTTVQRFFLMDSQSVATTLETASTSKADYIEIMPGVIEKVIEKLSSRLSVPIIAGGLLETNKEIDLALKMGAYAVSTGKKSTWSSESYGIIGL